MRYIKILLILRGERCKKRKSLLFFEIIKPKMWKVKKKKRDFFFLN